LFERLTQAEGDRRKAFRQNH
jgi:hypothetical protein